MLATIPTSRRSFLVHAAASFVAPAVAKAARTAPVDREAAPLVDWPTWEPAPAPATLPADVVMLGGREGRPGRWVAEVDEVIEAADWPRRFAALPPGVYSVIAGRSEPEPDEDGYGTIDLREWGWITIGEDGSVVIEPHD